MFTLTIPCIVANELTLIVEDRNLKLVRDALQVTGYRTIETETAEEGLRVARDRQPALILMNIQLPGINSIEALHRLRAAPTTRAIPVHSRHRVGDDRFRVAVCSRSAPSRRYPSSSTSGRPSRF